MRLEQYKNYQKDNLELVFLSILDKKRRDLLKKLSFLEKYGFYLASLEDIAAMKIIAISQRGKRRDFIDIYFLIEIFGLKKIIDITIKKYPMFNIYVGLQGLVYFKDADDDIKKISLLKNLDWEEVKSYILKEVNKVKNSL